MFDSIGGILTAIERTCLRTVANRLNAEHENLCREIDLETNVLEKLNETYSQAE